MKILFHVAFCLLFVYHIAAQNVGVGVATPTEKLDVLGNINVSGQLKLNGNGGQPGQILGVNDNGSQGWIDRSKYKNRVLVTGTSTQTFFVNGATELMVEQWGGGGGGAHGGGGGAGTYGCYVLQSSLLFSVVINNGSGGLAATGINVNNANNGASSAFTINFLSGSPVNYVTSGGAGATSNSPGGSLAPSPYSIGSLLKQYMAMPGLRGNATTVNFGLIAANSYQVIFYGGEGGSPFGLGNQGGVGGCWIESNGGGTYNGNYSLTTGGIFAGGGGGGTNLQVCGVGWAALALPFFIINPSLFIGCKSCLSYL